MKGLIIVYAGAAPGHHIPILAEMFPEMEWYLYDPRPFEIEGSDKIHINQKYFDDDIAKTWVEKSDDIIFISDIRSATYKSLGDMVKAENSIQNEMKMQEEWVKIIRPFVALLKMRLPYPSTQDIEETDYLEGDIMLQVFSGEESTETRLIVFKDESGKYKSAKYNNGTYENLMYYYNAVTRTSIHYLDSVCYGGYTIRN